MKIIECIGQFISGDWGEETYSEDSPCKVSCVRGADIVPIDNNDFQHIPTRFISQHSFDTKCLQAGDIIVEKSGGSPTQSTGRVAFISQDLIDAVGPIVCSNFCVAFRVKDNWNPLYIFYYFQYMYNNGVFFNFEGKTSGLKNLQLEAAYQAVPIDNIGKSEQDRIVGILDNIHRKITINRQINQNLEALARQLYDYWFVQFDFPDENGKPYKSSGGMLAFNKDIKRDIPVNWKVLNLKNCIQHINTGLNPRTNFQFGGNIKYVTVKNLTTEGTIDYSSCDYIDDVARTKVHKRSQIAIGDILYASICPLGRTHLITSEPKDWDINESVFSIRPNKTIITSEYLNMLLKDDYYIEKLTQNSSGSIFQGIRIKELENTKIIVPSFDILINYTKVIKPIINNQSTNEAEKQALIKQRNELLPLLMNGQVNSDLYSC